MRTRLIFGLLLVLPAFLSTCKDRSDDMFEMLGLAFIAQAAACDASVARTQAGRSFSTGFESVSDFDGFYLVPQNYQGAAGHELSATQVRSGSSSHRGFIYGAPATCLPGVNCNHRGYPTIQLHKSSQGGFRTPVLVEFHAYLNMTVPDQRWFSFATFSADSSDAWTRTVLVNLGNLNTGTTNYTHLMHVPYQGQSDWTYQTSDSVSPLAYPMSQWAKISVCLDFDPVNGSAKVLQNGTLVSSAPVRGGCGVLEQAHFGLYSHPGLTSGEIYNDDLTITEVAVCPF